MTETTSIEITQPTSLVEWRRSTQHRTDRCPLANDPVVRHLESVSTARFRPSEMSPVSPIIASALDAYLNGHTTTCRFHLRGAGGLAPWQVRRAKEMLVSRLDEADIAGGTGARLQALARPFARAFRQTAGRRRTWLMEQRIEKAGGSSSTRRCRWPRSLKLRLCRPNHFTRVFAQLVNRAPASGAALAQGPNRGVISAEALSDAAIPCQRLLRRTSQDPVCSFKNALRLSPATFYPELWDELVSAADQRTGGSAPEIHIHPAAAH